MKDYSEILKISDLTVGYKDRGVRREILTGINTSARPGEMIAVIGANGAGKSTLLRTVLGLHDPLEGEILLNNRNLRSYSQSELASYNSFVSASALVSANLTVKELVTLGRFPHTNWIGRLRDIDSKVIERSISSVGLSAFTSRKLGEMSDGERQRAMIARALAQDTRFVVLDEPTAYLDLPNKYELIYLLREIVEREKKTVVYTTHDLHIAIGESDKIWLLGDSGLFEGSPEDLMREGRFENLFSDSKLEFADESGLYIFPSRDIGELRLDASEKLDKLTRRALIRLKINIVNKDSIPLLRARGDYNKAEWTVVSKNAETSFDSIYELSNFLKRELFNAGASGNR